MDEVRRSRSPHSHGSPVLPSGGERGRGSRRRQLRTPETARRSGTRSSGPGRGSRRRQLRTPEATRRSGSRSRGPQMSRRDSQVSPLPFPACKANDIECLRRGIRTFFFLMESGHMGMRPVDPAIVNSVAVTLPEQHLSFLLRRVKVTGAKWTKLAERRFHVHGQSGAIFNSDLHVGAEIILKIADKTEPYAAYITMDIQDVESNITYTWAGTNVNNEDYILIGPERIAVRNRRLPSYFLQPIDNNLLDMSMIEAALQAKTSVLDHVSNEIVNAIMHTVVDNFRIFARKIPVKYYYQYSSFI